MSTSIRRLLDGDRPLRWVFTGDSITHGAQHTSGARDYVELFAEHLRWTAGRSRDHVLTTGISGRRIIDLEADLEWSLLQYRPHVVSLMFGMNDCVAPGLGVAGFSDSYRRVVAAVRNAGGEIVIHTPNRVGAADPQRARALPPYVEAVRRIADDEDLTLVDHDADWAAAAASGDVEYWISHGCHPGAEGHRVLARSLLRALRLWDPRSDTGRLYIPAAQRMPS